MIKNYPTLRGFYDDNGKFAAPPTTARTAGIFGISVPVFIMHMKIAARKVGLLLLTH
ncbi:MAG: hypothetical protein ACLUEQ_11330 [Cloacibacillus evryensis]